MAKLIGYGSVLTTTTSTGTREIGQIRSISGPAGSGTDVDTTTLDTTGKFRTFARGPVDPGTVTLSLVYDPTLASHQELGTLYASGTAKNWTVYHGSSTGNTDIFSAYISSMSREIPLDDVISCDVVLKVSGHPQYSST